VSALDVIRIARAASAKLMVDGSSPVLEADNPPPQKVFEMLHAHKPEILELLQAERRAVVRHIANHFQSSKLALVGGRSPAAARRRGLRRLCRLLRDQGVGRGLQAGDHSAASPGSRGGPILAAMRAISPAIKSRGRLSIRMSEESSKSCLG